MKAKCLRGTRDDVVFLVVCPFEACVFDVSRVRFAQKFMLNLLFPLSNRSPRYFVVSPCCIRARGGRFLVCLVSVRFRRRRFVC